MITRTREPKNSYDVLMFDGGIAEMAAEAAKHRAVTDRQSGPIAERASWSEGPRLVLPTGYMRSWDDVWAAAATPWAHGIGVVRDMVAQLARVKVPEPESPRRKPVYSYENGDEVDPDRLRNGQEWWRGTTREKARGPRAVTVAANVSTPADVPADQILWRPAAAVALCHALEAKGYAVDLWAFNHVTRAFVDESHLFLAYRIKPMGRPLNLAAVAAGGAGWYFRTIVFACYAAAGKTPCTSYGVPVAGLYRWQADRLCGRPGQPIVVLDRVWSFAAAVDATTRFLGALAPGGDPDALNPVLDRPAPKRRVCV